MHCSSTSTGHEHTTSIHDQLVICDDSFTKDEDSRKIDTGDSHSVYNTVLNMNARPDRDSDSTMSRRSGKINVASANAQALRNFSSPRIGDITTSTSDINNNSNMPELFCSALHSIHISADSWKDVILKKYT